MTTEQAKKATEIKGNIHEAERVLSNINPYAQGTDETQYAQAQALMAIAKILAYATGLDKRGNGN